MKISYLTALIFGESNANEDLDVTGVAYDSRQVAKGDVFVVLKGTETDGMLYIKEALAKGAVAVVTDSNIEDVPYIKVPDTRKALALLASAFNDDAHKKLKIIGVVGTNGKTTIATLIYKILSKLGQKSVLIGTMGSVVDGVEIETNLTTPDPIELHNVLRYAVDKDCKYCIMEVSAHAIHFCKVWGMSFDVAVFSNLSQDHLDFFKDMQTYKECKKSFFRDYQIGVGIVNVDDPLGKEIIDEGLVPCISYGIDNPADAFSIDYSTKDTVKYTVNVCDAIGKVNTQLYGKFNIYNSLAALTAVVVLGVPMYSAICALSDIPPIAGRYNVLNNKKRVIIDYAHTPDGLENVLTAAKLDNKGRVIAVFGCGGNRDKSKRKIMGEISGRLSDMTVVTTDNSRLEDPYVIMDEIAAGITSSGGKYQIIRNREDAISYALTCARPEDVVVVAGKGAEKYIDEGGTKRPYSDYETVEKLLWREDF